MKQQQPRGTGCRSASTCGSRPHCAAVAAAVTVEQPKQSRTNPKSCPLLKASLSLLSCSLPLAPTQSSQSRRAGSLVRSDPPNRDYTIKIYQVFFVFFLHLVVLILIRKHQYAAQAVDLSAPTQDTAAHISKKARRQRTGELIVLYRLFCVNPPVCTSTNQRQPDTCLIGQSAKQIWLQRGNNDPILKKHLWPDDSDKMQVQVLCCSECQGMIIYADDTPSFFFLLCCVLVFFVKFPLNSFLITK